MNNFDIVKTIHILNEIFLCTYFIIFPISYDIYFAIYLLLIMIHWIVLKNECILSYLEKKILDKNYELGSMPHYHPYRKSLHPYIENLFDFIKLVNLFVILYRNFCIIFNKNNKNNKNNNYFVIFIIFIFLLYLILQYNISKKYNNKIIS